MTKQDRKRFSEPLDLTLPPVGNTAYPKLKIWWIPQVPGEPFEILLSSFAQAKAILISLGRYDLFQLANNIKPDYCNAGGLVIFEDGEWIDYEGSVFCVAGEEFHTLTLKQCIQLDEAWANQCAGNGRD